MDGRPPRRGRRRSVVRLLAFAAAVLFVFWCIGLLVFRSYIPGNDMTPDMRRTDAIVVLTGGSGRVSEGLALLEQGVADMLFVSGVYHGVDVAALLKAVRQKPVEMESQITLGYAADDTFGNALETAAWMKKHRFHSLRLVTAGYHMPRSLLEFRRVLPQAEIVIHPVHSPKVKLEHWWMWPGTARLIVSEYNKYLLALAIGWMRRAVLAPGEP